MLTPTAATGGLQLYDFAMFAYFAAFVFYAFHMFWARKPQFGKIAVSVLWVAFGLHTWFLVGRSIFYYHQYQGFVLPSTNMFEAVSFFVWLTILLYFALEIVLKTRLFGMIALMLPVAGLAYSARGMEQGARELMPSLKSYWLVFHITAMFISYAAFALAFSFAIMYLMRSRGFLLLEKIDPKFDLKYLDNVGYKLIMFGFPILTLGVFLGAVWADSAWGRYWAWDPKETWALITWFVYLAYLHLRLHWKMVGFRSALFNIIGFVAVLITFQGVNLLDGIFKTNSIHAYAEGGAVFFLVILGLAVLIPALMFFLPMPKEDITLGEVASKKSKFKRASDESTTLEKAKGK